MHALQAMGRAKVVPTQAVDAHPGKPMLTARAFFKWQQQEVDTALDAAAWEEDDEPTAPTGVLVRDALMLCHFTGHTSLAQRPGVMCTTKSSKFSRYALLPCAC
jgi:hypothetical protein